MAQHQRRPIRRVEAGQHRRRHAGIDRRRFLDRAGLLRRMGEQPDCGLLVLVPANDRRACVGPPRSATPHPPRRRPRHGGHQPRTRPESDPPPARDHQPGWPDTNTHPSRCAHRDPRSRSGSPQGGPSPPPICASLPTSFRTSRFRRSQHNASEEITGPVNRPERRVRTAPTRTPEDASATSSACAAHWRWHRCPSNPRRTSSTSASGLRPNANRSPPSPPTCPAPSANCGQR